MTVHYKTNNMGLTVPVLHRVVYHRDEDVQAQYYRTFKDFLIDDWLKANCRHRYYHSPGYLYEKSIEFECDQDAMLFALRWS